MDEAERTFTRYPIRLLQVARAEDRPFLYDIDWGESDSLRASTRPRRTGEVPARSWRPPLRLAPLLRPAIELNWVRMVAAINRLDLESDRLHAHMFGATRSTFPDRLQSELRELQDDCCGHCGDRLRSRAEADHFVPWAH